MKAVILTAVRAEGARDASLKVGPLPELLLEVAVDLPLGHEAPVRALRPLLALRRATSRILRLQTSAAVVHRQVAPEEVGVFHHAVYIEVKDVQTYVECT